VRAITLLAVAMLLAAPAAGQSLSGGSQGRAPTDYNMIVITADDMGPDWWRKTNPAAPDDLPLLDTLADAGVRLDNFWAAPTCAAMRQQLWTGRFWTRQGGITGDGRTFNTAEEWTIGKVLQDNWPGRYDIGNVGELGLGGSTGADWAEPARQGLTWYQGSLGPFRASYWGFNERLVLATDYTDAGTYNDAGDATINGVYSPTRVTDTALAWFAGQQSFTTGKPFFLGVGYYTTHPPTHDPANPANPSSCGLVDDEACMIAMRIAVTVEIDRLLAAIPPDVWAKTLVLILWDNGTAAVARLAGHSYCGGKNSMCDDGLRVPAILTGGLVTTGGVVDNELRHVVDVLPTIIDYAAAPVVPHVVADTASQFYNGQLRKIDGHSMRDIITADCTPGAACGPHDVIYATNDANAAISADQVVVKNAAGYKLWRVAGVERLYLITSRLGTEELATDLCEASSGTPGDCSSLAGAALANYDSLTAAWAAQLADSP
jgi:arylsulfatase A-like enzyme